MAGKILRRCTICKNFHASYLVVDPKLGKIHLCYSCWKTRQSQEIKKNSGDQIKDDKNDPAQKQ